MAKSRQAAGLEDAAISMLIDDHRRVQQMFEEFESLGEDEGDRKQQLIRQACTALTAHAQLEEEVFYPAVHNEIEEPDLVDEAQVEHDVAKQLIARLEEEDLDDATRDATFKVLGEYMNHHIQEEESEMFKQVTAAELDTSVLAEEMRERKLDIESDLGIVSEEAADDDDLDIDLPPPGRDGDDRASRRNMSR
ncbi:MAG TPA: hemerythrin domain-containing protein [Burkholderiaceae bacterium]|nr:hemerythrin domain-containing protein [Burkholderiaceae bacterium]